MYLPDTLGPFEIAHSVYGDNLFYEIYDDPKFVIPYDKRTLKAFGGGFVHYCGKHEYLLEAYLQLDELRAINLGNPEMYEFNSPCKSF